MTTPPDGVPEAIPAQELLPEDVARMLANAQVSAPSPELKRAMRRKLLGMVLITMIGLGASVMSCVGQSFGLRQARALEGIEQQLNLQGKLEVLEKQVEDLKVLATRCSGATR